MTEPSALPISCAQLDWTEDGTPLSRQFDDIYFSKQSGIDETRYVFLEQNELSEKFTLLADNKHSRFCLGETGFGTGLNFLCAWQLRDQLASNLRLHFVSVDKHPLKLKDLERALLSWPELADYSKQLTENYPLLTPGWHHISFIEAQVELHLYFGEALEGYKDYSAQIDAWFLDGFAPSKNAPMWSGKLFEQIGRLSAANASFSTFSAAADVREGLKNVGFEVERVKGFGRKRHMLRGKFSQDKNAAELNARELKSPWFAVPKHNIRDREAVIIGGGIAGTSAAYSLARRGWQVTLLERNDQLGNEGSGNRQGVLYNKISAEPSIASSFYTSGYLYSIKLFNQINAATNNAGGWHPCGVIQLAHDKKERERQSQFLLSNPQPESLVYAVDKQQASEISGIDMKAGGLFYPGGGWATPSLLCQELTAHPQIQTKLGIEVRSIIREGDEWILMDANQQCIQRTGTLILANASDTSQFEFTKNLPLKSIRGQTTDVPANPGVNLKTVLCGKGYIGPAIEGRHFMGATFNLNAKDPHCRIEDHQRNLAEITNMAPTLAQAHRFGELQKEDMNGRVGFRCTSPDYLPLVGPVPNRLTFIERFARLRKDARTQFDACGEYLPGLYISSGHGSKGMTSCPLAGELLAAYINAEPFPFSSQLAHALNPSRFLIRDLIRNKV